eukprot:scaffold9272_cov77-Isochrysis_galbana.AAC.1
MLRVHSPLPHGEGYATLLLNTTHAAIQSTGAGPAYIPLPPLSPASPTVDPPLARFRLAGPQFRSAPHAT